MSNQRQEGSRWLAFVAFKERLHYHLNRGVHTVPENAVLKISEDTDISYVEFDKDYLKKEREQLYGDWKTAFWRELFQNSVDAGAKNISISLNTAKERGSFGNIIENPEDLVRVVFTDDGCGMDFKTLTDVYFKAGKSTKEDSYTSIGGFGRARIMTCFAQERYTILTQDNFVMGDGIKHVCKDLNSQIKKLESFIDSTSTYPPENASVLGLQEDLLLLKEVAKNKKGFKGCRIEVDLDKNGYRGYNYATLSSMERSLRNYLSESDIKAILTINGRSPEQYFDLKEVKLKAKARRSKRKLGIFIDGVEQEFAKVYENFHEHAHNKGSILYRVSGACMFVETYSEIKSEVIIEIDPKLARSVLTSNRDSIKAPYRGVINDLISELSQNTMTGLKKEPEIAIVEGTKGKFIASGIKPRDIIQNKIDSQELVELENAEKTGKGEKSRTIKSLTDLERQGLTEGVLSQFLSAAHDGTSFLTSLRKDFASLRSDSIVEKLLELEDQLYSEKRSVQWFYDLSDEDTKSLIVHFIRLRMNAAAEKGTKNNYLEDHADIYIANRSSDKKVRAAASRHHPSKWNLEKGTGKEVRGLLAMWTEACSHVIKEMVKSEVFEDSFLWTTGFTYSDPEEQYLTFGKRMVTTKAANHKIDEREFALLINPVKEDGTLRYSSKSQSDIKEIIALAVHEVAHILVNRHNEEFANSMTKLFGLIDQRKMTMDMQKAYEEVSKLYREAAAKVAIANDDCHLREAQSVKLEDAITQELRPAF